MCKWKHVISFLVVLALLANCLPALAISDTTDAVIKNRYTADQFNIQGEAAFDHADSTVHIFGNADINLSANIPSAGNYAISIEYAVDTQVKKTVGLQLVINNVTVSEHELPRIYHDENVGCFEKDNQGNDIRPKQVGVSDYMTVSLRHADYRAGEVYYFCFQPGDNTIRLIMKEQNVSIRAILIELVTEIAPYEKPEYFQSENSESIDIEAESPLYKSDSLLYPIADRTSVVNSPYHYSEIRFNSLGGENWKTPGQWVTWCFTVETPGFYSISFRFRQNITRGMQSYRRISVDGNVPCAELQAFAFPYDRDWQTITLGNDDELFYFYLDAGEHTLTMEATMGDAIVLYEQLEEIVQRLNNLYLQIVQITGVTPDVYRTYRLEDSIPDLVENITNLRDDMYRLVDGYEQDTGRKGSEISVLKELAVLLDSYIQNTEKIATTLSAFNSHISTVSTLLNTVSKQPLLLDRIRLCGVDGDELVAKAGFWDSLINGIKSFFASFLTDYTVVGEKESKGKSLSVWLSTNRDQADLLKSLIDETFTPETGIRVQLSLVSSGLAEAVMAGKGPDISLGVARTVPIDMGARGVLVDLTEYDRFDELRSRFQSSALNAYTYKDSVFGLPETQDFYMMYVRTDILEDFGITPPETWDDLPAVITALSQRNMEVGIPQAILGSLLVQNGLSYYQDDFEKTVFSTLAAYEVYSEYINFYHDYKQPYNFNAVNRFKTGVMPIVFDLLSFYNTMAVLAPEIKGKWEVLQLPGVRQADGRIHRSGDATGVASILLKSCENKESAFAFLNWWTSEETQYQYGSGLENLLGPAGRYATANVEAFERSEWTDSQIKTIQAQRKTLCEIPEIPGSYIIARNLTNLFLDVMSNGAVLRESMLRYADIMDEELERKKIELELLESY